MTAAVLVVADDLTGANAAAAGFARAGLRAVTVGNHRLAASVAEFAPRFDVVVVSTDSRHLPPEESRRRVAQAVRTGWPARLVCNRVDTTLRGNIGPSTAAMLDAIADLSGRRAVALCAPAHPAAGRHTVGGAQLLYGRRLEDTELVRDPLNPMATSDVAEIIAAGSGLRTHHVPLHAVVGPPGELVELIRAAVTKADALIVDAITEDHLVRAARAAVRATDEVVWVAVDPGPGSLALANALGLTAECARHRPPVLAVSGSATALTRDQLRRLAAERTTHLVRARLEGTPPRLNIASVTKALRDALAHAGAGEVVLLATVVDDADLAPMGEGIAESLPGDLAQAVRDVLATDDIGGLFSSGGDVTAALLTRLGSRGLAVEGEVAPLAVAGVLVGGPWNGLPLVTKGGLVGDASTTVTCIDHLIRRAEIIGHQVLAADPLTRPEP